MGRTLSLFSSSVVTGVPGSEVPAPVGVASRSFSMLGLQDTPEVPGSIRDRLLSQEKRGLGVALGPHRASSEGCLVRGKPAHGRKYILPAELCSWYELPGSSELPVTESEQTGAGYPSVVVD